ncbi:LmbE-like protein [Peniophora sp. CONT]|nr:LmbE-like protein [Peniophora sp. CONT]
MISFPFALAAVLALFSIALYNPSSTVPSTSSFPTTNGIPSRVLLLTAHPDDEAFFFGPTITALNSLEDVTIYSLCLSVGDGDGDGEVRTKELERSLDVLGIEEGRRRVLDKVGLKDGINTLWDASLVAESVLPFVLEHNITSILTFDNQGISSHPNHRSLYAGTHALLAHPSTPRTIQAYALLTVPLPIKYISFLSSLQAKLDIFLAHNPFVRFFTQQQGDIGVPVPVFVAGLQDWTRVVRAVLEHWSQMKWFRWLGVVGSRYFWVNEWVEIRRAT